VKQTRRLKSPGGRGFAAARERERETQRHTRRERELERETPRERHTERERDTETHTESERERANALKRPPPNVETMVVHVSQELQ